MYSAICFGQAVPEILYYKFDGTGTVVPNYASITTPANDTANIQGTGMTQGNTGQCGGALVGTGTSGGTDFVNTNWTPNLGTGSWTLSFWTSNIVPSATLWYILGDINTAGFRCFTNGIAGPNNWILRGAGLTDIYINGGATTGSNLNTFVYDNSLNNVKGYLNGVLVTTVAQTAPNLTGTGPLKVGAYATNANLNGKMDEFRLYNRALNATEVMELFNRTVTNTLSTTACGSYTVPSGDETYTASGTYMDTIPRVYCGDSILTINLTINNPSSSTQTVTSCNSYNSPSGMYTWTSSGTYNDTIANTIGCDSVITFNLTINTNTTSTISPTACFTYTVPSGDEAYTASGMYMDTIANTMGCDSILTINLTINSVDTSVTLSGATYTAGASNATYQWIDCSNTQPINGATNQTYNATANGSYAVIVTQNNCTDTSACYSILSVGMKENNLLGNVSFFPNPTNGKLNVQLSNKQTRLTIEVSNLLGEVTQKINLSNTQNFSLDIQGNAGLYFVNLIAEDGTKTILKVTKQ